GRPHQPTHISASPHRAYLAQQPRAVDTFLHPSKNGETRGHSETSQRMSSPGGPASSGFGSSSTARASPSFFSACGGGLSCHKKSEMTTSMSGGDLRSISPGQQSICLKCNRRFSRSVNAVPNSDEYERCAHCRKNAVAEWLQDSCVVS
ncbi:unnamed protein product, partial [Pylaiella littoralis]